MAHAPQTNELLKTVDFGFEVQAFLESTIGRYLAARAKDEVTEALELLKAVDPENPKAVRALQNRVAVAENVLYWLAEAIQEGQSAEAQLTQGD
ncbi:MAG: hypothetical protein PHI64_12710 [Zoogloea sp.]|uniref:hypothetical protein n=1 Tax=Zoogloea sp. TaxID=49181 RepID=UPI002626E454|nr:hypothetical protein [Zoogloea sp.]MDD2989810.1 hypothetical protein [Zoogloea sp.]